MGDEIWKDIIAFPNYEVSSFGRIRSLQRINPIILVQRLRKTGYPIVSLHRNGRKAEAALRRLRLFLLHMADETTWQKQG